MDSLDSFFLLNYLLYIAYDLGDMFGCKSPLTCPNLHPSELSDIEFSID